MKKRSNKGFTLLEVIIVIIIVGVLASLALPRLFSTVEYSRSTEALAMLGTFRSAMERCSMAQNGDYTNCNDLGALDVEDPTGSADAHFAYTFDTNPTTDAYTIRANRTTLNNGDTASWIEIKVTSTGVVREGDGAFAGIN